MDSKGNGTYSEMPYQKPEERSRWDAFRFGLYNPSTHEVLGRTCASWGGLAVFYSIFYLVLAAFFAICMKAMLSTIDPKEPYFTQSYSLIGSSPGLGYRPISNDVEKDGSLIWYVAKNETNTKVWTDRVASFLKPYKDSAGMGGNQVQCDYNNLPPKGKVCFINMDNWGRCREDRGYGYRQASPCIFVKLNKIYGWVPEYYNDTNDLPEEMPAHLKQHIQAQPPNKRNTVWVSCEGENSADKENVGPIKMYPEREPQGIPGYYFPYENQEGYLSPVLPIHFERPTTKVLINVECRAWAKNINYRRHNTLRQGSVHFELMID